MHFGCILPWNDGPGMCYQMTGIYSRRMVETFDFKGMVRLSPQFILHSRMDVI